MHNSKENHSLYLRFIWMFIDLSTETATAVLQKLSQADSISDFLKSKEIKQQIEHLKRKKILDKTAFEHVKAGSMQDLDLNTLITLIINLFTEDQLKSPKKGWDHPPEPEDESIGADLLRLRTRRNHTVAHSVIAELEEEEFNNYWDEVTKILIRICTKINPEYETKLKEKLKYYEKEPLDQFSKEKCEEFVNEWMARILLIQTEVDKLLKTLEECAFYLRKSNNRYDKYIYLLDKGVHFVLSSYLNQKIANNCTDFKKRLHQKESSLREKITDMKQLERLFPQKSSDFSDKFDSSFLDISSLATVILFTFDKDEEEISKEIEFIQSAHKNYATMSLKVFDTETFDDSLSDLEASLKFMSKFLLKEQKCKFTDILEESKITKSLGKCTNYLKAKGIKSFTEVYNQTLRETKSILQKMKNESIPFASEKVLELKMITCGSSEETTCLAEKILVGVWQEAIHRTEEKTNFNAIQKEAYKILEDIKKNKDIKRISVEQKCILLSVVTTLPATVLALIEYLESDFFKEAITSITKELGYHFGTIFRIHTCLTIESLCELKGENASYCLEESSEDEKMVIDGNEDTKRTNATKETFKASLIKSDIEESVSEKRGRQTALKDISNEDLSIGQKRPRRDCADADGKSYDKEFQAFSLTGILLDMSCPKAEKQSSAEIRRQYILSQIQVIVSAVQFDISKYNRILAAAVGGSQCSGMFDLIGTLHSGDILKMEKISDGTMESVFACLEENGAGITRKWVDRMIFRENVLEHEAKLILNRLRSDHDFAKRFVEHFLHASCRDWKGLGYLIQKVYASIGSFYRQATPLEIREVVNRSMSNIEESLLVEIKDDCIYRISEAASSVIGESCKDKQYSLQRILSIVDPFIYGGNKLYSSLSDLCKVFKNSSSALPNHQRFLFVISDGCSIDEVDTEDLNQKFEAANVKVVCFFTTFSKGEDNLTNIDADSIGKDGEMLKELSSSTFPMDPISRAIFMTRNLIDVNNEKAKLFFQVKDFKRLNEQFALVQNALSCRDSLLDLIPLIPLDVYINAAKPAITGRHQMGHTLATAVATSIHLSKARNDHNGIPNIKDLLDEVKIIFETENDQQRLQKIFAKHGLAYRPVDASTAMVAIAAKRPVIATFQLTDEEVEILDVFFKTNPFGILTSDDIVLSERFPDVILSEHAALLASFNSKCFRFMHFRGEEWADTGFFRVENAGILKVKFIDVYLKDEKNEDEKDEDEKDEDESLSKEKENMKRELTELKTKQMMCPMCKLRSRMSAFEGTFTLAKCPKCKLKFEIKDEDKSLFALNAYLTSLSR
ncbi:uncharacterized protein LOC132760670 [Ruditapes philippinarum]|uniref:uncharacterized protein LOC132760670 n=1 Tax=Ruditapes philippinarum TaxID=129788 RepID=UPI00295A9043|nr:uncharacterized protein LOC132760670 [Ruditapes philippinarum]